MMVILLSERPPTPPPEGPPEGPEGVEIGGVDVDLGCPTIPVLPGVATYMKSDQYTVHHIRSRSEEGIRSPVAPG